MDLVSPAQVVIEAREWAGTRWRHQGRLKGEACDCAGLIIGVGYRLGALGADPKDPDNMRRFVGYNHTPNPGKMMSALNLFLSQIRLEDVGIGDIVYLRFSGGQARINPQHLCIVTEGGWIVGGKMIHALAFPARKVVEHGIDEQWHGRSTRAYRYPGVARWLEKYDG